MDRRLFMARGALLGGAVVAPASRVWAQGAAAPAIVTREGAEIFAGSQLVGKVTSGGFAPTVGAPIAMGWVSAGFAEIGQALEIEVRGKRISATVAAMPFVPHRYHRAKA